MKTLERLRAAVQAANVNDSKYDLTNHYADAIVAALLTELMEPGEAALHAGIHAEAFDIGPVGFGEDYTEPPPMRVYPKPIFQAMLQAILNEADNSGGE